MLIWYEYYSHGVGGGMRETYEIGYQVNGHWEGDVCKEQANCIAWKFYQSRIMNISVSVV